MVLGHREIAGITGHEAGRRLLAELYYEQRQKPLPEIRLTERGKPYFFQDPLYFSITHTRHHVFCALSEYPVGIDAEETDRRVNLRLADKILSESEKVRYEQSPDRREALLRLWVLKEAYLKLLGTGITGYPSDTDFDPEDPRIRLTEGCLLAVMEEKPEEHPLPIL